MSQQGLLQQSIRDITGTALDYNGDWLALMASDSITTGSFNERLLAWINATLGTSYTSLPAAQQAFAVDQGYTSWSHMGAIALVTSLAIELLGSETQGLALDFTDDYYQADTGHYGSAYVLDTGTPANNYDSHPYGKLTYTSPSAKMTLGPTGTLRFGAHNLVTHTADGSQWTANRTTVTTGNGVSDPIGGTSAITITATGAASRIVHSVAVPMAITAGTGYSATVWVRRRTGTGTVTFEASDVGVGDTLTLSSTWQQYTYSSPYVATTTWYFGFRIATSGDAIDVYAPHIRRLPSDSTFLATTSAARYALPFEWDSNGNNLGILVEEARTNLCLYSDDLTNAAWTKSNMTTAKTATGADGVSNSATTCTATAGNATVLQSITSGSAARVQSCWIKRRTGTGNIDMTQNNGTTWATVTVTSSWTRVSIAAATVTNPIVGLRIVTSGDAVDVMLMQQEVGSFITSVIPTLGSTVTRAADNISLATSAMPFSSSVGTAMIAYDRIGFTSAGNVGFAFTSSSGLWRGAQISDDDELVYIRDGSSSGISGVVLTPANLSTETLYKGAYAFAVNDVAAVRNGGTPLTGATFAGITFTGTLQIGSLGGSNVMNGRIKQLLYVPRRMSNAELQAITT